MAEFRKFLIALTALTGIILSISHAAADEPGALVSVEWLKENLQVTNLVVLDIRSPRKSRNFYEEGHIKGAVSAPYNSGWRETVNGVIGMLPPIEKISAHIGSLGVGNETRVVIVPFGNSSTDFSAATRIYWTFKVLGHDAVSILEGGYAGWYAKGEGLSDSAVVPVPKEFVADYRPELVASETDVQQSLGRDVVLVDARPTAQFEGKAKSPVVSRAGTVPAAVNLRQSTLYSPRKTSFLGLEKIRQSASEIGISEQHKSIAFCNTGHWASIAWFALSEIAGHKDVSLYDGSMTEWTANADNPIQ